MDEVFNREAQRYFDKNVEVLKRILENVHKSFKARTASDKARKGVMKQLLDVDTKSKLAACSSKNQRNVKFILSRVILRVVLLRRRGTEEHRRFFHFAERF